MARLIRKTAKVSGSGGGKINVRGREWTKEDLRELKNHSREKTPAKTIAKLTKRTVGALRQKAFILVCRSAVPAVNGQKRTFAN